MVEKEKFPVENKPLLFFCEKPLSFSTILQKAVILAAQEVSQLFNNISF